MALRLILCVTAALLVTGCAAAIGAGAVVGTDEYLERRDGGDGLL